MPIVNAQFFSHVLRTLKPHGPDAVLTLGMFFAIVLATSVCGLPLLVTGTIGVAMMGLYAVRQTVRETHLERMADINVRKTASNNEQTRLRQQAKLDRERAKAPTAASAEGQGRRGRSS